MPYIEGLNAGPGRAASMLTRAGRDSWADTSDVNRSGIRTATRIRFFMGVTGIVNGFARGANAVTAAVFAVEAHGTGL
jgi:hypothetical protein